MTELRVGDAVVYRPYPDAQYEDGVVTRVNEGGLTAFVRFRGDFDGKLCYVRQLERARG